MIHEPIILSVIEEAKKSEYKPQMGAVIFDKRRIVSLGHNYGHRSARKLHPRFQNFKGSIHAEVDSIIKAKTDLSGYSMLVIRVNNKDQLRLAKPCNNCLKYIEYVGIRRVFYSVNHYPYITELDY
jgi:deoxycytidylate deaminase